MEIDMLKLDIEGAEVDVIVDCLDRLHNIHNVLVEYHSFRWHKQRIDELLHAVNTPVTWFAQRVRLLASSGAVPRTMW
jgi:hypothetical protein